MFYVGKGQGDRCDYHVKYEFVPWDAAGRPVKFRKGVNLHKLRKISQIIDSGGEVGVHFVGDFDEERESLVFEVSLIALIGLENLTNITRGGDGVVSGRSLSEDHKNKISDSMRGKQNSLGYRHTPETIAAMSDSRRGISKSEETKKKMSETAKKRWSPDVAKRLAESRRGRKMSEETKLKISAALKGRKKP